LTFGINYNIESDGTGNDEITQKNYFRRNYQSSNLMVLKLFVG